MTTACLRCGFDPSATVVRSWTFTIARKVTSGNAHVHNVGAGRHAYRKERDGWFSDFAWTMKIEGIPPAAGKRRVTLTRLMAKGERPFDTDNLATGMKPCVDAMVTSGLLVDDAPKHAEIHRLQEKRGILPGLHVLIEELADAG